MPDTIDIKIIKTADAKELKQLYKEAGWWEASDEDNMDFLNKIVEQSALFAGAFYKKKLIGMGRALSDQVSDAYIQDVTVLKDYRKKGIGKKIIQVLIDGLKEKKVSWIGLVAEPGTTDFYNSLGFEMLKGHVPLKYKGQQDV